MANDRNIESIDISRGLSVFKRQRIPKEVLPREDNLVVEGIGWHRKDFLGQLDGDYLDTWNKNDRGITYHSISCGAAIGMEDNIPCDL